jgi:oligoribonuclease
MVQGAQHLIWIDLEMTGLEPETDTIIEIATVITDKDLNVLAEGPVLAVHQPDYVLAAMDDWNQKHHGQSGLIDRVRASTTTARDAELATINFLKEWVPEGVSPMCGNTIGQDRRFLRKYMPKLESYFHYRSIDVSTLKELALRWSPGLAEGFKKQNKHEALADIHESIAELCYYRERFINSRENA